MQILDSSRVVAATGHPGFLACERRTAPELARLADGLEHPVGDDAPVEVLRGRRHEHERASPPSSPRRGARLVLLRHGATTAPAGVYLGSRLDPPLSALGEEQARAAGALLAGRRFGVVLVSPLLRARRTAELAVPGARAAGEPRLRELDMGEFSGLAWAQIKARDREAARAWRAGQAAPGGEPAMVLWQRCAAAALDAVGRLGPGEDALLVAHSGPIRALVGCARGLDPATARLLRTPHGGVRVVRLTPAVLDRWRALAGQPGAAD